MIIQERDYNQISTLPYTIFSLTVNYSWRTKCTYIVCLDYKSSVSMFPCVLYTSNNCTFYDETVKPYVRIQIFISFHVPSLLVVQTLSPI